MRQSLYESVSHKLMCRGVLTGTTLRIVDMQTVKQTIRMFTDGRDIRLRAIPVHLRTEFMRYMQTQHGVGFGDF